MYYPTEARVLAILLGQQATPNQLCRIGFTWAMEVPGRQLSGQTSILNIKMHGSQPRHIE